MQFSDMSRMINQYKSDAHPGEQPVRVLQHNMIKWLEDTNPEFRRLSNELIFKGQLQPGIEYHIGEEPILYDRVSHFPYMEAGNVVLHETFLSYLWCICYALTASYEELIDKPVKGRYYGRDILEAHPEVSAILQQALQTLQYGLRLIHVFEPWDKSTLPNPEFFPEENTERIGQTNAIYLAAVNFILCHEIAHVHLNHFNQRYDYRIAHGTLPSSLLKQQELDADNQALAWIIEGFAPGMEHTKTVGILSGLSALLLVSPVLHSATHPDRDVRLANAFRLLKIQTNDPRWAVACIAFRFWDLQYRIGLDWEENLDGTYDELFLEVLRQ